MVFFPTLMSTAFTANVTTVAVPTLTASVVKDFFTNLLLNPGNHFTAVIVCCAVAAAPCIGLAFLIKMTFEKYCPKSDKIHR